MIDRARCGALALAIGLLASPALAQDYPTRPITDIVASTPGGGTDIISRIVGEQLAKQLGQPLRHREHSIGSLNGTVAAAKAAPDGYTLTTGLIASMAVNPSLFAHLPYDPIRNFEPIAMLAKFPFAVVVSKNFPAPSIGCTTRPKKRSPFRSCSSASPRTAASRSSCRLLKSRPSFNPRSRNGPTWSSAPA